MTGDLARAFNISAMEVGGLASIFFYTYAAFALVSGAALDRFGARGPVSIGAVIMAVGALLFALGDYGAAQLGRLLQGAGSAFALTGAVYVAASGMQQSRLALAIGLAQGAGMLGAWAGVLIVSTALQAWLVPWQAIWIAAACMAGAIAIGMVQPNAKPIAAEDLLVAIQYSDGTGIASAGWGFTLLIRSDGPCHARYVRWKSPCRAGSLFPTLNRPGGPYATSPSIPGAC
jgi:MFS family permease